MYDRGKGVAQDYTEAVRWSCKAAEKGDTKAQHYLGDAYRRGLGVPQDLAEAIRWYRKSAEQGDVPAQCHLFDAYRQGQGVPQNYIVSSRWLLKLAGPIALRCARRKGWTPLFAILSLTVAVAVPQRRWGRAVWVSWALMCCGSATYVLHLASGAGCSGRGRILKIGILAMFSVISALGAIAELRKKNRRADADQPPPMPTGTTDSPA
jgi:hypothetical protein